MLQAIGLGAIPSDFSVRVAHIKPGATSGRCFRRRQSSRRSASHLFIRRAASGGNGFAVGLCLPMTSVDGRVARHFSAISVAFCQFSRLSGLLAWRSATGPDDFRKRCTNRVYGRQGPLPFPKCPGSWLTLIRIITSFVLRLRAGFPVRRPAAGNHLVSSAWPRLPGPLCWPMRQLHAGAVFQPALSRSRCRPSQDAFWP